MTSCRNREVLCGLVFVLAVCVGCGSVRETLPPRSAMEQLLISTAADRAISGIAAKQFAGKNIFLDDSNLEAYDKPYVMARLRQTILDSGGSLAESAEEAQIVLEAASGGLSVNRRDWLFGLPSIPIPVPFAGETLKFPELPILKALHYRGKAKFIFTAVDPATNTQIVQISDCYGTSRNSFWWVLLFGPFEGGDLPEELK